MKPIEEMSRTTEELISAVNSAQIHARRGRLFHAPDGEEPNEAAHEGFARIEEGLQAALALLKEGA